MEARVYGVPPLTTICRNFSPVEFTTACRAVRTGMVGWRFSSQFGMQLTKLLRCGFSNIGSFQSTKFCWYIYIYIRIWHRVYVCIIFNYNTQENRSVKNVLPKKYLLLALTCLNFPRTGILCILLLLLSKYSC